VFEQNVEVFRRFRAILKEALSCLSVRPSVRMEHLGCQWKDLHKFITGSFTKIYLLPD